MNRPDTETEKRHGLSTDPNEINHLVCCREPWRVAFCGTDITDAHVNLRSPFVCTMCVEVVRELLPSFDEHDDPVCPRDGTPCPDEFEIDARIAYETS